MCSKSEFSQRLGVDQQKDNLKATKTLMLISCWKLKGKISDEYLNK